MQALMLAAGQGKRLANYTKENTKCMVEVNEEKLIDRVIKILEKNNIHELIMVVGYKKENLKRYLENKNKKIKITFIDNSQFDKSNNIYSLYLAKEILCKEDTILLESDLIYEEKLISNLIKNSNKNLVVVDKYQTWMDGTVVSIDEENNIEQFIEKKDIKKEFIENYYKTVNIYKLSKEFSKNEFIPFLETFMNVYGKDEYYELALKIIANLGRSDLKAEVIKDIKWYEIDNEQDLAIAKKKFKNCKIK